MVAVADGQSAVSISAGLLLIVLTTTLIVGGILIHRARTPRIPRVNRRSPTSRGETQRMLAEDGALVEKTARNTGMSEEEIARVRANVLGFGDG